MDFKIPPPPYSLLMLFRMLIFMSLPLSPSLVRAKSIAHWVAAISSDFQAITNSLNDARNTNGFSIGLRHNNHKPPARNSKQPREISFVVISDSLNQWRHIKISKSGENLRVLFARRFVRPWHKTVLDLDAPHLPTRLVGQWLRLVYLDTLPILMTSSIRKANTRSLTLSSRQTNLFRQS